MTDKEELLDILRPQESTRSTWGVLFGVEKLADAILKWHIKEMSKHIDIAIRTGANVWREVQ
jgi:hypothetical protein